MRNEFIGLPRDYPLIVDNYLVDMEDLMDSCKLIDFLEDCNDGAVVLIGSLHEAVEE